MYAVLTEVEMCIARQHSAPLIVRHDKGKFSGLTIHTQFSILALASVLTSKKATNCVACAVISRHSKYGDSQLVMKRPHYISLVLHSEVVFRGYCDHDSPRDLKLLL